MSTVSSFLIKRYLSFRSIPRAIRIILILCYAGIGIGACSLMTTLIITRGFEEEIGAKMQSINSDVLITGYTGTLDAPSLEARIKKVFGSRVKGISPSSTRYALLERSAAFSVMATRGIDPIKESVTTILESKITFPYRATLRTLLQERGTVIIGSDIARAHGISIGDTITLRIPHDTGYASMTLQKQEARVTGIFSIGLKEYDAHMAYCSQETLAHWFENVSGCDSIAVTFSEPPSLSWTSLLNPLTWLKTHTQRSAQRKTLLTSYMKRTLPMASVRSWSDLYPGLASSLELEKYVMTIVLALIALVASMLMICLLFMLIQHKQKDIAILRAMGLPESAIYRIFSRIGFHISLAGVVTGLSIAGIVGLWIAHFKPIKLPSVYYISYLPATVEPLSFLVIFCATLALSWIASRIPLAQLRTLSISSILRGQ